MPDTYDPEEIQKLFYHSFQINNLFINLYFDDRHPEEDIKFNLYVVPDGLCIYNWSQKYHPHNVKVYDESGWIHKGPWQKDFDDIIMKKLEEKDNIKREREFEDNIKREAIEKIMQETLSSYGIVKT